MDYMSDILARLQRGESVEAIASQLTKDINAANDKYNAELEAKRKAEQEAKLKAAAEEAVRNDKIKAMSKVIDAVVDLLAAYEVDPADIIDTIDEALPAIQEYMELMSALEGLREKQDPAPAKPAPAKRPTGDPIEDFLNQFVR